MPSHNNKTFGASGTPLSNLPSAALTALGGRANVDAATQIARELIPQQQPIDPALLSLMFFSNLAAESSKPGATALGAAGTALQSPTQYMIQRREEQRKAEAALPQTALSIAQMLKPPTIAGKGRGENFKKVGVVRDKNNKIKYTAEGIPVYKYRVEDNAGFLIRMEELPDLDASGAVAGVEFYNTAGDMRRFIPGTQEYERAMSGEGEYNLPKKPDKFTARTVYKDGEEMKVYSQEAYNRAVSPEGGWSDVKDTTKDLAPNRIEGERAIFLSEEDAKKKLADLGVKPEDVEYNTLLEQITTDDPDRLGKPVILGQQYVSFYTDRAGEDGTLPTILKTPQGSPVPLEVAALQKDLQEINKTINQLRNTEQELLPSLDTAMAILLNDPNATGILKDKFLDVSRFFQEVLQLDPGTSSETVLLQALSNRLAPKMRAPGSGSTSDIEFEAYKQAILSLKNTALANYIAVYSLSRQTRNNTDNIAFIKDLKQQFISEEEINKRVRERDKGIYEKWTDFNPEDPKFNTGNDDVDSENFRVERDKWFATLPVGAVILNRLPTDPRKKLFPNTKGTFIVKGWKGSNKQEGSN